MTIAGAVLCFGIRFMAIRRGWHLPVAGSGGTKRGNDPESRVHGFGRRMGARDLEKMLSLTGPRSRILLPPGESPQTIGS